MADVFSKEKRSWIMGRVKGANTKPEMVVRRWLHAHGYRFRLHRADLPGKPDIVLAKYRTVVFVHGCFWHGHPGCGHADLPASNREYWEKKIGRNVVRDRERRRELRKLGWRVVTIWECSTRDPAAFAKKLLRALPKTPVSS